MMRSDYLPWDDYFLSVAFLSAMRSKDPCSQVGACIVNSDKIIVSIGYNGMPRGCSDDKLPWAKIAENKLDTKYMYVCHAEMNAVINKRSANVAGCTIYVALFPCNECAKIIIQSRIKEVVFYSNKHEHKPETIASRKLLDMAGVSVRQFFPACSKIKIDFNSLSLEDIKLNEINSNNNDGSSLELDNYPKDVNKKRLNYLSWEEYFMTLAFLSAQRSKDPLSREGACIVNSENKIVGIGYNGMPRGCDDKLLPWKNSSSDKLDVKDTYECHAEMNAILNKNCGRISNCTMYVTLFPCNECAKFIIQEDIKEIVFFCDRQKESPETKASKIMFDMTGVIYKHYNQNTHSMVIDFEAIDWNNATQLPPTPLKYSLSK